jgi:hypothetical protein
MLKPNNGPVIEKRQNKVSAPYEEKKKLCWCCFIFFFDYFFAVYNGYFLSLFLGDLFWWFRQIYAAEIDVFFFEVKGSFDGAIGQVFDVETHLLC